MRYIDEDGFEKQGKTLRCEFTDSIATIKTKIRAFLELSETAQVNMFEVNKLTTGFCQLMNPLSEMADDKLAKDTDLSNQSVWMVTVDQPELETRLLKIAGKRSVPITMKL